MGDDRIHVRDELGGHGRAVLTATNRTEYAWEGKHIESAAPRPSHFTGALIEGLRTGAADLNGDGRITVTELYEYVYEYLQRVGVRQHPRMWADLEYQFTIARVVGAPSRDGSGSPPPARSAGGTADPRDTSPDEIMDASFGAANTPEPYTAVRRGQDALIRLELTLEETVSGTEKDITVDTAVVCSTCSGAGWGTTPRRCEACAGRGEKEGTRRGPLEEMRRSFLGQVVEVLACPTCRGRGIAGPRCPECDGPGRVRARRELTLKIPPGVGNGTRIQLAGQAEVGPGGGEPGDLYVEVVELPHRIFQRRGDDLHCVVTIPRATAITGGVIQVDTLDGTKKVKIPQGTRHDRTLRLADLGAAHLSAGGRGDLLIHLETGN